MQFSENTSVAGSARLWVLITVSTLSFFYAAILEYSLPLYFNSVSGFSKGAWSTLVVWQIAPWCFASIFAGVLGRMYGERRVWAVALLAQAFVPLVFLMIPSEWIIPPLAFWAGISAAVMWVSGLSLVQIVPRGQRGVANGLLMMSLGVGSLLGPLAGRALLWRERMSELAAGHAWGEIGKFLINVVRPTMDPSRTNFAIIFVGLALVKLICAVLMWRWGQYAGAAERKLPPGRLADSLDDLKKLIHEPRFWALVVTLCFMGAPAFQATNQYLRYRAEDLGLIAGGQDVGWIILQLVRTVVWVPGGLLVGLIAGRRASGLVAIFVLLAFALACASIGSATTSTFLFVAVACFEILRQGMRWLETGFLSEHFAGPLRSSAIGCSVTISGIGATLFGFWANHVIAPGDPQFKSALPFWIAGAFGVAGAIVLYVFNRRIPIRQGDL